MFIKMFINQRGNPVEPNPAFAKLTEVAPSGLQQLSCNKNREAAGLDSFTLYQKFEKRKN